MKAENSKQTAKKPRGTPFPKGQTGNPGGRPKRTPEELDLVAACKAKTPAALIVMERIMEHGENERNQLAAATAIMDRAYGKPTQPLGGDPDRPLQVIGTIRLVRAA